MDSTSSFCIANYLHRHESELAVHTTATLYSHGHCCFLSADGSSWLCWNLRESRPVRWSPQQVQGIWIEQHIHQDGTTALLSEQLKLQSNFELTVLHLRVDIRLSFPSLFAHAEQQHDALQHWASDLGPLITKDAKILCLLTASAYNLRSPISGCITILRYVKVVETSRQDLCAMLSSSMQRHHITGSRNLEKYVPPEHCDRSPPSMQIIETPPAHQGDFSLSLWLPFLISVS